MDDAAEVLQECAANPDDDSPRLVWADIVGGERGELVVIQCDLARGNLTPSEAAKRRARERELLDRFGVEWAGDVADIAARWTFRRGFIESVKLRSLAFDLSLLPPLASTVMVATGTVSTELLVEIAGRQRLRGLGLHYPRFATKALGAAPALSGLRAVSVEWPTLDTLVPILLDKPITQLRVTNHPFSMPDVQTLVAAAPGITSLDISPERGHSDDSFIGVFMQRPLRALRITQLGWKHLMYMAEHSAATLEHLAFPLAHEGPRTLGELAKYTALRTLELAGGEPSQIHAAVEWLARSKDGFAQLRVLKIDEQLFPDELATLRARFANQLEVLETPIVAEKRMLHDDVASSFTLGPPSYARSALVFLAQPGAKVWELPPRPADEPITIGRDSGNDIVLFSSFVARRHAGLLWENGSYTLEDYGSDNGTWVDGAMLRKGQRMADGTRFVVGNVPLVYCIGDGAKERAQRIVQSVGGT